MKLNVRLGTVPILWNNDDVPDLTPPVPFEGVLEQIARAGFEGTELGSNYPQAPAALRGWLGRFGLTLSGGYFCAEYTDRSKHPEVFEQARRKCELLAAAGARHLVVADQLHPTRVAIAGRVRAEHRLPYADFAALTDALGEIARIAARTGLDAVFHNHAGTWVETPDELDALMSTTDPLLGLCLDTGHYFFGGGDPAQAIRRYQRRLRYLHLKDVDPGVLARVRAEGLGFLEALRQRVFTETACGAVDLPAVLTALAETGFSGWVVCEQDTGWRAPMESASLSRRNLAQALSKVADAHPVADRAAGLPRRAGT